MEKLPSSNSCTQITETTCNEQSEPLEMIKEEVETKPLQPKEENISTESENPLSTLEEAEIDKNVPVPVEESEPEKSDPVLIENPQPEDQALQGGKADFLRKQE